MSDPLPRDDSPDTAVARALLARGAAPLPALRAALEEVRARRDGPGPGATLADALRARGHAAAADLARSLAGEAAPPGSAPADAGRAPRAGGPRPGSRVGPYTVVRPIAAGGMGAVLEVEAGDGRRLALKTILPDGLAGRLDPTLVARFRREAELLARLDHPNVVRIHGADLDGGAPYLVQDLLGGGSLEDRLQREGPLPVDAAVDLVVKLARAVDHAHGQGVLHRDLKPLNVLFDDRGEPRLVDFGLARSLLEATGGPTRTGEALGTPSYMAPEQALGEPVDARTDVYGLGGVLYACLTGAPPVAGASPVAVMDAVVRKGAPSPRLLRPEVSPALEAVVLRALDRAPARRHATALDLARALREAQGAALGARGRGGVVAAAALAVVAAVAVAVTLAGGPRRPSPAAAGPSSAAAGPSSTAAGPSSTATGPAPPGASPAPPGAPLFAPGERLRLVLVQTSRTETGTTAVGSMTIAFAARVAAVGTATAALDATIEALDATYDVEDSMPPYALSSARPEEASPLFRPLVGFVGARLALEVDAASGALRSLRGLAPARARVRSEIVRAVGGPGGEGRALVELMDGFLGNFGDDVLRQTLDRLLQVHPTGGAERWTREEARVPPVGWSRTCEDLLLELKHDPGARRVRWRLLRAPARPTLTWTASGRAELDARGRVAWSEVDDTLASTAPDAPSWRFAGRNTLRLASVP